MLIEYTLVLIITVVSIKRNTQTVMAWRRVLHVKNGPLDLLLSEMKAQNEVIFL
jgi:hypothetical protein